MNRFIDFKNFKSIDGFYSSEPIFEFEKIAARKVNINPLFMDSGETILSIPFFKYGQWIPLNESLPWTINLDTTDIDLTYRISGLIDGLSLAASTHYQLWSFANESGQLMGFGLIQKPISTFQCSSAGKGSVITLINLTKAYRFTVGSRLRVEHNNVTTAVNDTDWNLGTITEIVSSTSLKATLDNDTVFQRTYGSTIPIQASTGGLITQLDNYQNFIPDSATQETFHYFNRLIAVLKTDGSSNIDGFSMIFHDKTKVGTIDFWDKNRGDCFPLLFEDWQPYNGKSIKVDRSPLIGETLPDINTDNRYLSGANTSGVLKAATALATYPREISSEVRNRILNPDSTYNSGTLRAAATTTASGNTYNEFNDIRPITMTAKIILKVR